MHLRFTNLPSLYILQYSVESFFYEALSAGNDSDLMLVRETRHVQSADEHSFSFAFICVGKLATNFVDGRSNDIKDL